MPLVRLESTFLRRETRLITTMLGVRLILKSEINQKYNLVSLVTPFRIKKIYKMTLQQVSVMIARKYRLFELI